jgi:hypothetical protein
MIKTQVYYRFYKKEIVMMDAFIKSQNTNLDTL